MDSKSAREVRRRFLIRPRERQMIPPCLTSPLSHLLWFPVSLPWFLSLPHPTQTPEPCHRLLQHRRLPCGLFYLACRDIIAKGGEMRQGFSSPRFDPPQPRVLFHADACLHCS